MSCYARLEYDCVLEALEAFSVEQAAASVPRTIAQEAARLLAVTYVVRDLPGPARQIFYDMLSLWPEYELQGDELSPRFFALFDEARTMLIAQPVAAGVPAAAQGAAHGIRSLQVAALASEGVLDTAQALCVSIVTPDPVDPSRQGPDLRLGVGLGSQVMVGGDRDAFDDSLGVSVRVATDRFLGLSIGFAFDRYVHTVGLSNLVPEET